MSETPEIRILLTEDHVVVRDGLKGLLESEPGFRVVAEAINGRAALDLLDKGLQTDVLLTDLNMPEMGGLELTQRTVAKYPGLRVIILSALDNEKYVIQTFKAGAVGFVLKNVTADELKFAVRHVYTGNDYVCSELTSKFINRLLNLPEPPDLEAMHDIQFNARETEVLLLLADGMTNQEIADKLFTSKRTVEGYRENMITKAGVRNTVALIRFAVSRGIIS